MKASFGFGENVCWTEVGRALREASVRSAEEQHLTMSSRWVTRINIKVDRVACPWLIRRFIDPRAEFIFVPENELLQAARAMNAIPFDAPKISEIRLNHRGERLTRQIKEGVDHALRFHVPPGRYVVTMSGPGLKMLPASPVIINAEEPRYVNLADLAASSP